MPKPQYDPLTVAVCLAYVLAPPGSMMETQLCEMLDDLADFDKALRDIASRGPLTHSQCARIFLEQETTTT